MPPGAPCKRSLLATPPRKLAAALSVGRGLGHTSLVFNHLGFRLDAKYIIKQIEAEVKGVKSCYLLF